MLAGLAGLHGGVAALDESARLRWLSLDPTLARDLAGGDPAETWIGRDAGAWLAALLSEGDPRAQATATRIVRERGSGTAPSTFTLSCSRRDRDQQLAISRFDATAIDGRAYRILLLDLRPTPERPPPEHPTSERPTSKPARAPARCTGVPSERVAMARGADASRSSLARRNEELEAALRGVAHDLRSPLVSMLGFARLLREERAEPLGRTGLHFLDRIEQGGRSMERLLRDVLELTRIADTPRHRARVNPTPVLQQVAAELKLRLEEAGIELRLPKDPPIVVCDRTRLYQLFSNLIGNAIRHMHRTEGGWIEVGIEDTRDGWRISVEDNGPGIAEKDRHRIFAAFETAKRPPEARGGRPQTRSSGLGLAIVRKIVEAHQGGIQVESEPGAGARFVVDLPRPKA